MRNLKKVLSLTLALVMMLGMMTFAGAAETAKKVTTAADLTDMDKVVNKEAVSLLVDLKIVAGRDTGAFDPTGTLSRGEFAKMIYVSKMGEDDKALNFVGAPTGLTDLKGKWSEGYVNYCYSTGIVSGRTPTVFDPDGKVKTAEAAKMLLVLLGYDAKAEGYTANALWSVNVMQQAKQSGLLAGVKDAADAFLTRDSAAQMISNALFANTVKNTYGYDMNGKKYVNGSEANDTTLGNEVFNLMKEEISVTGINSDGTIKFATSVIGLATKINAAKFDCSSAMLGNKLAIYYKATSFTVTNHVVTAAGTEKLYTTAPVVKMGNVLGTSTDGTTIANLTNKNKDTFIAELGSPVAYFLNGTSVNSGAADAGNKVGVIVEFIDNGTDGLVDVVKMTKKTVATLTGDTATKAVSGKDTQVKVPGVIGSFTEGNTVKNVVGYEGLKKDDVVLYVKVGNITTIEKAKTVEGQMTAKKQDGSIVFGGTHYEVSGLVATNLLTSFATFNKDAVIALDDNGTVVSIVLAAGVKTETKYAIVADYAFVTGSGVAGSSYGEAKLIFTDGTSEVVKVSKVDFDGWNGTGTNTNGLVAAVNSTPAATSVAGFIGDDDNGKFFTYSIDADGKYELTKLVDQHASAGKISTNSLLAATAIIEPGKAEFATGFYGDANTIFLMATINDGKTTYSAVKGVANAPRFVAANNASFRWIKDGNLTTVVYISNGDKAVGSEAQQTVYFLDVTKHTDYPAVTGGKAAHKEFAAIVNGEIKTVLVSIGATGNVTSGVPSANGLYSVTYTGDLITNIGTKTATAIGTVAAASDVVGVASKFYTYATDAAVFTINDKRVAEKTGIEGLMTDDNDVVTVVFAGTSGVDATTVKEIYVVKTAFDTGLSGLTIDNSLVLAPVFAKATTSYAVSVAAGSKTVTLTPTVADGTHCEIDASSVLSVVIPADAVATNTFTLTAVVVLKDSVNEAAPVSTTYTVTITLT